MEDLKQMQLTPDTHIWFDQLSDWTPAGRLEELKELFIAIPPPFRSTIPPQFNQPLPSSYNTPEPKQPNQRLLVAAATIGVVAIVAALLYFTSFKSDAAGANGPEGLVNPVDSNAIKLQALEEKEKQRQAANEARTKQNMEYRNNWRKYILFEHNKDYRVSSLGGISNLKVAVWNNADKVLDEVVLTINYYKENGEHWETKEITLSNIQPGSYESSEVPNTSRGTRFEAEISKVTAKSLHFCYNSAYEGGGVSVINVGLSGNPNDPWFCK